MARGKRCVVRRLRWPGTWTGTITVHVTRANHHAARDKGNDMTYTLSSDAANPRAVGDSVHVLGRFSAAKT